MAVISGLKTFNAEKNSYLGIGIFREELVVVAITAQRECAPLRRRLRGVLQSRSSVWATWAVNEVRLVGSSFKRCRFGLEQKPSSRLDLSSIDFVAEATHKVGNPLIMLFEFHSLLDVVHEFSVRLPRTSYVRQLFVLTPIEAAQLVVGFRRNWPISPPIALCSRRLFVKQQGSCERDARRRQNVDALGWSKGGLNRIYPQRSNCRKQTEQCIMVEIAPLSAH